MIGQVPETIGIGRGDRPFAPTGIKVKLIKIFHQVFG
jgi:hypothetical protein